MFSGVKWLKMGNTFSCKDDDKRMSSIKVDESLDQKISAFKKRHRTLKLMWFEDSYYKSYSAKEFNGRYNNIPISVEFTTNYRTEYRAYF
jgi:hypothetical protein